MSSKQSFGNPYGSAAIARLEATLPQLEARIAQLGVRIFVFTNRHGQDQLVVNPALRDWIERNTHREIDVGDYSVYIRNP